MQIISCKEAKAQGLKRYYTGKPCKHGHVAERHVTGGCVVCANLDQQRYYWQDPEKYRQANRTYLATENGKQVKRKIQNRRYWRNPEAHRAEASLYRALRLQRVPRWAELEQIAEFYAACPPGYEVDHIVPLLGELVSGLHVLANLQYLTMPENRAKRNKF